MSAQFVIIQTVFFAVVWSIPVVIVGLKMRRKEIPQKNFLIITTVLYWMSIVLSVLAEAQHLLGINLILDDPNIRAKWIAFLWPISFASSLSGFFVTNDRKESIRSALKLFLSFLVLVIQVVSLMN